MPVNGVRCRQSRWSCRRERCLIVSSRRQSSAFILSRATHGPSSCPQRILNSFALMARLAALYLYGALQRPAPKSPSTEYRAPRPFGRCSSMCALMTCEGGAICGCDPCGFVGKAMTTHNRDKGAPNHPSEVIAVHRRPSRSVAACHDRVMRWQFTKKSQKVPRTRWF